GRSRCAPHNDERSAGGEEAAYRRLAGGRIDLRQRARDLRGAKLSEPEGHRARQVFTQHRRGARRDPSGVALACEGAGVGHGELRRCRRDRDVDEVRRRGLDLRIYVRPLRHAHARGWKRRYMFTTAADGKWVEICVVAMSTWPSIAWIERRAGPPSGKGLPDRGRRTGG